MACEAAKKMNDLITNYTDVDHKIDAIQQIEHNCDMKVHEIVQHVNRSFITPIDREDINEIAKELDNITDAIEDTAHRFRMFDIKSITDDAKKLSDLIVTCTNELKIVMVEMKNMKTSKELCPKIIEVNRIENVGDVLYRNAMSSLFTSGMDTLEIIKWKEIYEFLENSLDACEDVANTVEGVVMKHA
jgi:predicted phosphate transport protein (TIGR00153 family)